MSMDGQHILVNGKDDGTLVYLKWKYVWHTASNAMCCGVLNSEGQYLKRQTVTRRDPGGEGTHRACCRSLVGSPRVEKDEEETWPEPSFPKEGSRRIGVNWDE